MLSPPRYLCRSSGGAGHSGCGAQVTLGKGKPYRSVSLCYSSGEHSLKQLSCAPGLVPHAGDGVPAQGWGEEQWWNARFSCQELGTVRCWGPFCRQHLLRYCSSQASIWHPPFRGLGFLLGYGVLLHFWAFIYFFFHWDVWKKENAVQYEIITFRRNWACTVVFITDSGVGPFETALLLFCLWVKHLTSPAMWYCSMLIPSLVTKGLSLGAWIQSRTNTMRKILHSPGESWRGGGQQTGRRVGQSLGK